MEKSPLLGGNLGDIWEIYLPIRIIIFVFFFFGEKGVFEVIGEGVFDTNYR